MLRQTITLKDILDEVFQDYKLPSMLLAMPACDFKCFRELKLDIKQCQNFELSKRRNIILKIEDVFSRYNSNPITKAIILGGLEPFLSFGEIHSLIDFFRKNNCFDDIVIYTGYYKNEIEKEIKILKKYENIIIKFGRFLPDSKSVFDEILGINLASENQYAEKI
ncbi:MAG: 4Fe-4S cluster-binding domain-containing protein [Candidatus Improbicoccus pseudotrichonymphae]|uniref:4Fe-4S cluster-binding domain-containing protein n=1 Tax=Candidatus Improbicoccus pseudotrichonymphae TaxID=3033792 RepID=A0AA48I4Y7_9FIRM|nr:MAG: 4Fe-4S cluster-binding domain-containing protein [Candidatus Improbicoccus pseudotrichonymphae]